MYFRKNILDQLNGGIKILFITVLIYPEEICKSYTKNYNQQQTYGWIIAVSTNTKGVESLKPEDISFTLFQKQVRVAAFSLVLAPFFGAFPPSQESQEDACVFPSHVLQLLLLLQWFRACLECALLWSLLYSISAMEGSAVGCELNQLKF